MKLRPYKSCDAQTVVQWLQDESVYTKWCGQLICPFPIVAEELNRHYLENNGGCSEEDNFYPQTALDDDGRVVGHFIMRYTGGDPTDLRFGRVVVDNNSRGRGIGSRMLSLGLKYAFEIVGAERVTIGVYESNAPAHRCYLGLGFRDNYIVDDKHGKVIEMELLKEEYLR